MSVVNLLTKINLVKKAENLAPADIEQLNNNRFKRLLKHVLANSPFYKKYYGQHGITITNCEKARLLDLPTIDKNLMMENYDDFICDTALKQQQLEEFIADPSNRGKKYLGRYQVIHTSGSTGRVGIFVYGSNDWNMLKALAVTRITKAKINPFKKDRISFIGATGGMYAGISMASDAPKLIYDFLPLSINSPLDEITAKVNAFQPDIICGYSSGSYLLAQEQLKDNINLKPKRIICSADPLTNKMRRTITEAFGVEPINFYAASEAICMGAQCELHQGIHLFNDWHSFELVDENLNPVQAGQSGKLIMTNLYNYTQPLIRYKMSDELVFDDKACSCKWPFPVIKSVAGRQEEFLWFERNDGSKDYIHPLLIVEFFVPGLEKLQVIQTAKNKMLMKVVVNQEADKVTPAIRTRMNEILRGKKLDGSVSFNIELVDEIKVDPKTGKFKLIIPLGTVSETVS